MITKSRGRKGWIFHLTLRVPVWWRPFRRQQAQLKTESEKV